MIFLVGLAQVGWGQENSFFLLNRQQPVQFSLEALYQSYSDDSVTVSQASLPVLLSAPIGRHFGLSLMTSPASASGDGLTSLSGMTDVKLGVSYSTQVGEGSLVANVGLNLPSGKRELSDDEFLTSVVLSQHFFNFRVRGFGQGFNVAPGLVWAFPVSESVVVGIGASYQYKGSYKPRTGMTEDFTPGDEILLTGGLDFKLGETTNLSTDITYTLYGSDKIGDQEVYSAGDKILAAAQLLHYMGFNEIRVLAYYRSQAKSSLPGIGGGLDQQLRTLPNQAVFYGAYRHRLSRTFFLGGFGRARLLGETDTFEAKSLFDVGVTPEFALTSTTLLRLRATYTLGDFSGYEVGGHIVLDL